MERKTAFCLGSSFASGRGLESRLGQSGVYPWPRHSPTATSRANAKVTKHLKNLQIILDSLARLNHLFLSEVEDELLFPHPFLPKLVQPVFVIFLSAHAKCLCSTIFDPTHIHCKSAPTKRSEWVSWVLFDGNSSSMELFGWRRWRLVSAQVVCCCDYEITKPMILFLSK